MTDRPRPEPIDLRAEADDLRKRQRESVLRGPFGGYSGSVPASEMGPPPQHPSVSIPKPRAPEEAQ